MPVIAVANSKGGSGKSTTALILAGELADRGGDVILIDADPRRPAAAWSKLPGKPATLSVVSSAGERRILDEIEQAASTVPFVIVDLEGTASRLTSYAIGQADLVLVPAQEEHQDAQAALDTVAEVRRDAQAVRRLIPAAFVLTRTSAIKSRTARYVADQLRTSGAAPVLKTQVMQRGAFSALWSIGGTVRGLDVNEVRNLDAAIDNVRRLADEVLVMLAEAEKPAENKTTVGIPRNAGRAS